MTKKPFSSPVRTLDTFQDKKENKVIKVLQKVNDKMVDIIAEAKQELEVIGTHEEGTYTTDDLIFDEVEKMLQKYQ